MGDGSRHDRICDKERDARQRPLDVAQDFARIEGDDWIGWKILVIARDGDRDLAERNPRPLNIISQLAESAAAGAIHGFCVSAVWEIKPFGKANFASQRCNAEMDPATGKFEGAYIAILTQS